MSTAKLQTGPRYRQLSTSGVARIFFHRVRNSVIVSNLQSISFTVSGLLQLANYCIVFIGVCTNCPFYGYTLAELQPQSVKEWD